MSKGLSFFSREGCITGSGIFRISEKGRGQSHFRFLLLTPLLYPLEQAPEIRLEGPESLVAPPAASGDEPRPKSKIGAFFALKSDGKNFYDFT